jgi:hypothetical protein
MRKPGLLAGLFCILVALRGVAGRSELLRLRARMSVLRFVGLLSVGGGFSPVGGVAV